MGYEIDFLPVGEESSGGDAIALRYGNLHGKRHEQTVVIIDGGYTDCGKALVEHVQDRYGTSNVDLVVSTHPDQDHVTGLEVVLDELRVDQLWMHLPWNHSSALASARSSNFRSARLSEKVEASLQGASNLEKIANRRGVPITEPFTGETFGVGGSFKVLGPTRSYYEELLLEMPEYTPKDQGRSWLEKLRDAAKELVPETLLIETLRNDGETSPRNNSSAVCLLSVDGDQCLFTGDAGMPALESVADVLDTGGYLPGALDLIQIPHHGSRNNVGPDILNRLLGAKGGVGRGVAIASAPKKNPENRHPAKKVTNAFIRRGYAAYCTQGSSLWHNRNAPARDTYSTATATPFYSQVEDDGGA